MKECKKLRYLPIAALAESLALSSCVPGECAQIPILRTMHGQVTIITGNFFVNFLPKSQMVVMATRFYSSANCSLLSCAYGVLRCEYLV